MIGLPVGWTSCTISEAMESTIGGVWGEAPGEAEIDVDVIRVTEMKAFGRLEPGTAARRSVTTSQMSSRSLQPGDLLLEKSGGGPNTPVGRVGIVVRLDGPTVCSNFMQLMRPNRDVLIPRFLMWHLVNAHITGVTASLQTATTNIRNLKMKDYWEVRLHTPGSGTGADRHNDRRGFLQARRRRGRPSNCPPTPQAHAKGRPRRGVHGPPRPTRP